MGDTQLVTSKPCIGYLGPQASFTHQAALEAFCDVEAQQFVSLPSFEAILSAIQDSSNENHTSDGESSVCLDFALLPVENSTNGGVVPVLDLLVRCGPHATACLYPDIEIVAEHYLQVHHCLFVHESVVKDHKEFQGTDRTSPDTPEYDSLNIKTLYSHPQVWGQCGKFLSAHFPQSEVERIHMSSTSAAATFVAQNPSDTKSKQTEEASRPSSQQSKQGNKAAICSSLAGQQNKLVCIASNIEDEPGKNTTRFFIIRNRRRARANLDYLPSFKPDTQSTITTNPLEPASSTASPSKKVGYKSLITFTIPHESSGSLASALSIFKKHSFNLTAITTRPSRETPWHYVFFIECEMERDIGQNSPQQQYFTPDDLRHDKEGGDGEESAEAKRENENVQAMFDELSQVTERSTLLGTWVNRLRH